MYHAADGIYRDGLPYSLATISAELPALAGGSQRIEALANAPRLRRREAHSHTAASGETRRPDQPRQAVTHPIGERIVTLDYVIVGAGPAGLQMGHYLASAGRRYVILEAGAQAGAFFTRFPRHRLLLSLNKRHNWFSEPEFNLRHDWNSLLTRTPARRFTDYSEDLYPDADTLVRYLNDYAAASSLAIHYRRRVVNISGTAAAGFTTSTDTGETYQSRAVLLATGAVRPRVPGDVEGIEHVLGYEDHPIDPGFYRGKRVAILGRGNSAFEVGNHLAGHAAIIHLFVNRPVTHAWDSHYPGDLRSINNTLLDMYQLKALHATVGFRLKAVHPRSDGALSVVAEEDYPHWDPPRVGRVSMVYDHVIRCTGWNYADVGLFDTGAAPELDEKQKYPRLSATWESTVPGVYYMGTAMQGLERKAASAFIHGFRYNVRTLFHLLESRFHGVPYPSRTFPIGDEAGIAQLAAFLIARVSTVSSLYQQYGVLCDVLAISGSTATYLADLPAAGLGEIPAVRDAEQLVVLTLDYGFHRYPRHLSPLEFIHPADPRQPRCSAFLHPIFRHYAGGQLQDELELGESLVVRYDHYDYDENNGSAHASRIHHFLAAIAGVTTTVRVEHVYTPETEAQVLRPWPYPPPALAESADGRPECRFARRV